MHNIRPTKCAVSVAGPLQHRKRCGIVGVPGFFRVTRRNANPGGLQKCPVGFLFNQFWVSKHNAAELLAEMTEVQEKASIPRKFLALFFLPEQGSGKLRRSHIGHMVLFVL